MSQAIDIISKYSSYAARKEKARVFCETEDNDIFTFEDGSQLEDLEDSQEMKVLEVGDDRPV